MEVNRDIYYNLAGAIVRRAIMDYVIAYKSRKRNTCNKSCYLDELEHFFHSEWFETLCPINGDRLMQMIQDECNNKGKKRKRR